MKDTTPTIFIIFGITGDIASRKILPALLSLYVKKKISSKFAIIGFTPEYINKEDFRQSIRDNMGISPGKFREEDVKHFVDHIFYEQGYYDRPESYFSLLKRLKCLDDGFKQCSNKLFHLSVAPSLLKNIVENLSVSGLSIPCEGNGGWTRIIIEKPFGYSETSAIEINNKLLKIFTESQIFRTDYYLAKDVIQNILSFRFSNSIFEPLWNRNHIEKVHIKLYKSCGIEDNGSYYDKVGALRDIGQSHLLQILALLSMEKPKVFDSEHFRKEKANIFKKLVIINKKTIQNCFVKAQYEGYKHEKNISEHAQTETYFRLKTNINNKRWKKFLFNWTSHFVSP